MFKKVNLICVISLGLISLSALNIKSVKAETKEDSYIETASNYDAEAALYGVSIDKDLWEVRWNNNYDCILTTWDDAIYGITDIHIGEAFYKEKINGQYRTSLIYAIKTMPRNINRTIHHQVLWHGWDEEVLQYGVLSYINVKSKITDTNAKVIDSNPKYVANGTSYSIGSQVSAGISGVDFGISASVSFVENAIDITNLTNSSDKNIDIKVSRNKACDNAQSKKQMAQENWFYFRYDCLTDTKYLKQEVSVILQYQMLEDLPEKNPNVWRTSTLTWGLNFI